MDYPKSVPNVGLVNGKFVDENIATGVVGSLIPSAWGNSVTDEIISVIKDGGFTPDEADSAQLSKAIAKIALNATPAASETKAGIAKVATDADFTAGTDDSKLATVKKVVTWFGTVMKQATESAFGWAKIATQTQVNSGTDDTTVVTPKKLRLGFSISLAKNGYIALPSWMGALIVQWGAVSGVGQASAASSPGPTKTVTLPVAFPNETYAVIASMNFNTMSTSSAFAPGAVFLNSSQISVQNNYSSSAGEIYWLAIGR